jgi:hypothetical protein
MEKQRKRLFYINKYQLRVLLLVLMPPIIIVSALAFLSSAFFNQLMTAIEVGSTTSLIGFLEEWKIRFLVVLWGLLTLVIVLTYTVSKNLLGAFGRLFREMDEMIDGQRETEALSARKHDELANELLSRVNKLTQSNSKPH